MKPELYPLAGSQDQASERTPPVIRLAWPVLLSLVAIAVLIGGYVGLPAESAGRMLQALFITGVVYVIAARLTGDALTTISTVASTVAMTGALAVLWVFAGVLANPGFVAFFALPIVLAGLCGSRRIPVILAILTAILLPIIALASHEEARWFIQRWGWAWPAWATLETHGADSALSTTSQRPDLFFAVTASALLAIGIMSSMVGTTIRLLTTGHDQAQMLAGEARKLAERLLASDASSAVLIEPRTGAIVAVNDTFKRRIGETNPVGKGLFDLISIAQDGPIRQAIDDPKAAVDEVTVVAIQGRARLMQIRINAVALTHEHLAHVQLGDPKSGDFLQRCAQAVDLALVVLDHDDSVRAINDAARSLLGLPATLDASVLTIDGEHWWHIAPRRRLRREVTINGKRCDALIIRERPYGADHDLLHVSLQERSQ